MKNKAEFKVVSPYEPAGDQPLAIEKLSKSILDRNHCQIPCSSTLL
jgi:excinuclease ABC subunit B